MRERKVGILILDNTIERLRVGNSFVSIVIHPILIIHHPQGGRSLIPSIRQLRPLSPRRQSNENKYIGYQDLKKKQRIRGKGPIHNESLFTTIDQKLKIIFNVMRKV